MRDLIGNRIEEGHLLWWMKLGIPAKVVRIFESRISPINGKDVVPPSITIELTFPIDPSKIPSGQEAQLGEFLRIVDPKQEDALNRVLGGTKQ